MPKKGGQKEIGTKNGTKLKVAKLPPKLRKRLPKSDQKSGTKKEHKPKLLSPIFSGGVGVFHVQGWGPKSSQTFWRDIPGFCRDMCPKFEKKKCSILGPESCEFFRKKGPYSTRDDFEHKSRKRPEYGFGEYGFKHRAQ